MAKELKLISWNVNGIRAAVRNGFEDFLRKEQPDILGLQEIKIDDMARAKTVFDFVGYQEYWNPAVKKGYSGTAALVTAAPLSYNPGIGNGASALNDEGRVQTLEYDQFFFVNIYFPNAQPELERLSIKGKFNAAVLKYLKKLEEKKPVIVCGDFNVAHQEIDLAQPKSNIGNAGFTAEERRDMDSFIDAGFVDTFRLINKDKIQYSWWSYRQFARDRNIGWRIDYFLVSESLADKVKDAFILDTVLGSDHAPVGIVLDVEG